MDQPGGALGELRWKIRATVTAVVGAVIEGEYGTTANGYRIAVHRQDEAQAALDAALAAVEARIGRLARFVRAYDAFSPTDSEPGTYAEKRDALHAARAALTVEDLT